MNSPPDPGSPISTDSSGSPPPEIEEINPSTGGTGGGGGGSSSGGYLSSLTSHLSATFSGVGGGSSGGAGNSGSASKRRLPTGSGFGAASSARDAKSRRRGEGMRMGTSQWEGLKDVPGGKKDKEELIDTALVEYLRKEIGDPFQEP